MCEVIATWRWELGAGDGESRIERSSGRGSKLLAQGRADIFAFGVGDVGATVSDSNFTSSAAVGGPNARAVGDERAVGVIEGLVKEGGSGSGQGDQSHYQRNETGGHVCQTDRN